MSTTKNIKSQNALPVAISEDCQYVAVVNGQHLELHQTSQESSHLRTIPLQNDVQDAVKFVQWSRAGDAPKDRGAQHPRVLCMRTTHISVFDAEDEDWAAEIDAGDGSGFVHADFTPSGEDVICFLEFNVQMMIFNLNTSEQRIIKTPKFSGFNGYAFRPQSAHLAILLKLDGNDVLSVHEPESYRCIATAAVQLVDVQGLKWSPNGTWIACWGNSLAGTAVAIYTADGQYYRAYTGGANEIGFGVKTVEWSPDSGVLALGKQGGTVELINGKTFSLAMVLGDPITVPIGRDIYTETNPAAAEREYALAPESPVFPFTYNVPGGTRAISAISFNPTGTMVATIDNGLPHILWLWSIQERTPCLAGALVQKSNIKQILWSTEHPELLMTTSDDDVGTLHQWICGCIPRIARIPHAAGGKNHASWIQLDKREADSLIWFGWQDGYTMGYLRGAGQAAEFIQIKSLEEEWPQLSASDFPCT
ncbi:predicted protein [Uncinocarpus reesii 1704]|uniref:Anaphase-promoting complex subunit 4 WD40 domain-containing protein n=1 Tax=Uncinocarpus reesii (strain UAMH 1704) TaxID=336963 RepID=C4JIP1_UNCRE|nr:uncharacterized protein UREG_02902 [Uncinocarpus reesii 1704]EEP78053.1 predicted protein [Uncinocarpus reesii 1704]